MPSRVSLVKPSSDFHEAYIAFYEEWKASGEHMVPFVIKKEPYNFSEMLHYLTAAELDETISELGVPHSTYWLIDGEQKVVGVVNIRHRLNQRLLDVGGHIGYGIRPSERRKGHATAILSLALEKARERGLHKVLVTCDKENTGSERAIVKNGGVLESEFTMENGNVVKRFWIED